MKGFIGVDEVGRGPLAGPITLCAVYIEDVNLVKKDLFANTIRDSKAIKKSLRLSIYKTIRKNRYLNTHIEYAIASRSAAYIDKHGLTHTAQVCALSCMKILEKKGINVKNVSVRPDAGLTVPRKDIKQKSFIKGDERYVEIALASIIAKEYRDGYMRSLSKRYRHYAWEKNAGYGTSEHRKAILDNGITKYHRVSFLKGFKLFDKTEQ